MQLISADSVGYLYLNGDTAYNKVVATLNKFAGKYVNTSYAASGRSVGTNPTNPTADTTAYESLVFNANPGLLQADTKHNTDVTAMGSISDTTLKNIGGYYWLPSRYVFKTSEVGYFGINTMSSSGEVEYRRMVDMYIMGSDSTYKFEYAYGVRPVVKLKDGINLTGGKGTAEVPFEL